MSTIKHPPADPNSVYCIFNHHIISSDNIHDINTPMRIGQLGIFVQLPNNQWVGFTAAQIFDTNWIREAANGLQEYKFDAPHAEEILGKRAYQVNVSKEIDVDVTTDRDMVEPTGRVIGTVISCQNQTCYIRLEPWFVNTSFFKTHGRWVPRHNGVLIPGERLRLLSSAEEYDKGGRMTAASVSLGTQDYYIQDKPEDGKRTNVCHMIVEGEDQEEDCYTKTRTPKQTIWERVSADTLDDVGFGIGDATKWW